MRHPQYRSESTRFGFFLSSRRAPHTLNRSCVCAPLVLTPRDPCACPELRPWPAHLPLLGVSVAASSRSCRKGSETSFLASDGRPRQGMGTAGGTRHDGSLQARASKSARLRAAVRRLSGVTARLRCLTARHAAGGGGKLKSPSGPAARRVPRAPGTWKFENRRSDRRHIVRGCAGGAESRKSGCGLALAAAMRFSCSISATRKSTKCQI